MASKKKIDSKYEDEYVPISLDNIEVQWAHLIEPDVAFGGNKWCVDLILPDELAGEMEAAGFNIKERKDKDGKIIGKNVVTAKKEVMTKKGKNDPPKLFGPDGKPGWDKPIGNGSICNLRLTARKWPISSSITLYIEKAQIVKHVEYTKGADDSFGDTTGGSEPEPF